jgi:hypothetical protein
MDLSEITGDKTLTYHPEFEFTPEVLEVLAAAIYLTVEEIATSETRNYEKAVLREIYLGLKVGKFVPKTGMSFSRLAEFHRPPQS